MARGDPQINVRISDELKMRLEAAAVSNGRSFTQEVAARLQASFEAAPPSLDVARLVQLQGQLGELRQRSALLHSDISRHNVQANALSQLADTADGEQQHAFRDQAVRAQAELLGLHDLRVKMEHEIKVLEQEIALVLGQASRI